ncbi:MAG: alanyl-tRNA editing protein [Eubacteriales bacterium]|nr:alanyl-tRNA editing protein [Eubacteriales bacterium]
MKDTIKLFDQDARATEFEAAVLAASFVQDPAAAGRKKDKKGSGTEIGGNGSRRRTAEIILDRTLFFPEEGGQTPDRGEIDGYPVIDVQLDGGVIRHIVQIPADTGRKAQDPADPADAAVTAQDAADPAAGALPAVSVENSPEEARLPFAPGQTVRGQIDFARRFSNMQNHSGEHILSGLVHGRFGYDNVGFHLSDNTVTLDFNGPLSDADLEWLENAANRVVWDNLEIRAWYPEPRELEDLAYRSKKEIDGPLRLVEIPGVDLCACCAPHVRRTGEIGMIKILRTLREKGGIRLTILCGSRALAYLQQLQKGAEDVSHLTNMPREEIAAGVSRILEDNEQLRRREAQLEAMYAQALAAAVPAEQQNVFLFVGNGEEPEDAGKGPGAGNVPDAAKGGQGAAGGAVKTRPRPALGNLAQRNLVNALCAAHPGYCGVFVGSDTAEGGYKYIIGTGNGGARSAGTGGVSAGEGGKQDARVLNACLHKTCGARGGGKPAMVQGTVRAPEHTIRAALERALCESV